MSRNLKIVFICLFVSIWVLKLTYNSKEIEQMGDNYGYCSGHLAIQTRSVCQAQRSRTLHPCT